MASLEDLVQDQDKNAVELQRAISNHRKMPRDRRTLDYLERKKVEFEKLWLTFEKQDNRIRRHQSASEDHPYFSKDIYSTIKALHIQALGDISEQIRVWHIENPIQKPQPAVMPVADPTTQLQGSPADPITVSGGPTAQSSGHQGHSLPHMGGRTNSSVIQRTVDKQKRVFDIIESSMSQLLLDRTKLSSLQIDCIKRHWQMAQELHEKIFHMLDEVDVNIYDINWYLEQEQKIVQGLANLEDELNQVNRASAVPATPESHIKLPRVELPTFSGNYMEWKQYMDLFQELVHKQPISDSHKIWYLKASLSGEAASLIQHFSATAANYSSAWKLICDRYDNTRLLVTACLQKLLSQPYCNTENAASIRQLHDTTQECLLSLENIGVKTTNWDPIIIHVLMQRLPKTTHALWEQSLKQPRELQSLSSFLQFLEVRFQTLETVSTKSNSADFKQGKQGSFKTTATPVGTKAGCITCKGEHPIFNCEAFLAMSPPNRLNLVQRAKLCVNCLKPGHNSKACTSRHCTQCDMKHNTLLHLGKPTMSQLPQTSQDSQPSPSTASPVALTALPQLAPTQRKSTLLSTVQLSVVDKHGSLVNCRAMLDSGSQSNFITQRLVKKLGISKFDCYLGIEGIGQSRGHTSERVNIQISSNISGYTTRTEAQVLQKIVSNQPAQLINIDKWNIPDNLQLADPVFQIPGPIDLLIGAELFFSVLSVGQIKLSNHLPILQNTLFGWVVGGSYSPDPAPATTVCGINIEDQRLNSQLERFWALEESPCAGNNFTAAEQRVENHFKENIVQRGDGRFIVRLPFLLDPRQLGSSRDIALQRFHSIERKLSKDENLKSQYIEFMRQYEQLDHMSEILLSDVKGPHYFLPHHAVLKPDSTTTKLRVVFDASTKTLTNLSLNDVLATGPCIQEDVFTILLRFRLPQYAFTADIEKMFRQILVDERDRNYQLILWREDPSHRLKCYRLNTITYGTTCAPYLATRVLQHLAETHAHSYPLAADSLRNNFYVDDALNGANTISIALQTQDQLRLLLQSAGFNLRKWVSNDPRLLKNIDPADREISLDVSDTKLEHTQAMGLIWHPQNDIFVIRVERVEEGRITKRSALSDIARLFDPIGFIAPVVVRAKIFLQQLWKLKLDWDAALPQQLHSEWEQFRITLELLRKVKVPRHVLGTKDPKNTQLHIFSDASEQAYGVVAYLRTMTKDNVVVVRFLCAKSRVAPVKQVTLPRLELCAATLAAELLQRLQKSLNITVQQIHLWTDSTIVLGWLNSTASNYTVRQ